MSDAIKAGAEALAPGIITAPMHEYSRRYDNHDLVTRVQHQKTVMGDVRAVLDAATADVEAMARVLAKTDGDEWLFDLPKAAQEASEVASERLADYRRNAKALRDWMLGGEG